MKGELIVTYDGPPLSEENQARVQEFINAVAETFGTSNEFREALVSGPPIRLANGITITEAEPIDGEMTPEQVLAMLEKR